MEKQSREISEIFTSVPKNKRKTSQSHPTAYSSQSQNKSQMEAETRREEREKNLLKANCFH